MSAVAHRVKTKRCGTCKELLPTYRFHKNRRKKDGLHSQCAKCALLARAERAATVPEEPKGSIHHVRIPAERLLPLFEEYLRVRPGQITQNVNPTMVRAIHRLRYEVKTTGFDFADRWLIELGLSHLWHVPAEDGGLADLYESDLRRNELAAQQTPAAASGNRFPDGGGSLSTIGPAPSPRVMDSESSSGGAVTLTGRKAA